MPVLSPTQTRIFVVSGIPRSGTSLMMQMLAAGGLPCLYDDMRPADASNPHGYFEYAPVKRLDKDASCLEKAQGKAVKIIYRLLPMLPLQHEYVVFFMQRPLEDVVRSQRMMLVRLGQQGAHLTDAHLIAAYESDVDRVIGWARSQPKILFIPVDYNELLQAPRSVWKRLCDSCQLDLDVDAMSRVVDPAIHGDGLVIKAATKQASNSQYAYAQVIRSIR